MRTVTLEQTVRNLPIEWVHSGEFDSHEHFARTRREFGKVHRIGNLPKLSDRHTPHGGLTTRGVFKESLRSRVDRGTLSRPRALAVSSIAMSLDKDYPMSRTQARVLVVGLVTMAVIGGLLFGGIIPGLKPNYSEPATVTIGGESYYYTQVKLQSPALFSNSTTPQAFLFHNISFFLWVTNWNSFTGGLVWGNGTEPNGTVSHFVLGQSKNPPVDVDFYVAPDRAFAVSWPGGWFAGTTVRLMVRA